MKLIAAVLTALLLSTPALGATYYIRGGGNNGNSGADWQNAWRDFTVFNSVAQPGDVAYVYPGYYSNWPNPVNAGSSATGGGWITVIGASLQGDPLKNSLIRATIELPNLIFTNDYIVVKGVKVYNVAWDSTAVRDSLNNCEIAESFNVWGPDYCTVHACDITLRGRISIANGRSPRQGQGSMSSTGYTLTRVFKIINSNITQAGRDGPDVLAAFIIGAGAETNSHPYSKTDSLCVEFNTIDLTSTPTATQGACFALYTSKNFVSKYNRYLLHHNNPYITTWKVRSAAYNALFNGDIITCDGSATAEFNWTQNSDANSLTELMGLDQIRNLTIDSTYVLVNNGIPLNLYSGMRWLTITYSVFSSGNSKAVFLQDSIVGTNVMNHDTFSSPISVSTVIDGWNAQHSGGSTNWHPDATWDFINSIVALGDTSRSILNANQPCNQFNAGSMYQKQAHFDNKLNTNNNLYAIFRNRTTVGDRSVAYFNTSGAYICSSVGTGTPWDLANLGPGGDSLSRVGDARFGAGKVGGSLPGATFDPRIGSLSMARGLGSGPSDAGAVAYATISNFELLVSNLYFGAAAIGVNEDFAIGIQNPGDATLNVLSVVSSDPSLVSVVTSATTVAAGAVDYNTVVRHVRQVCYDCLFPPTYGTITITTDSPVNPVRTVSWSVKYDGSGGSEP